MQVSDLSIRRIHYGMNDSWFQVKKHRARDIMLIISLVEEHIFSVGALCGIVLQCALRRDAMLTAQFLPKFKPN